MWCLPLSGCQDAFEKLDPEGSGRISVSDLKAFLHLVGLSPMSAELEALSQKAAEGEWPYSPRVARPLELAATARAGRDRYS